MPSLVSSATPTNYKPTRKWLAAVLSGLVGLAILGITQGTGPEFQIAAVVLVGQMGTAYLVPNESAPEA